MGHTNWAAMESVTAAATTEKCLRIPRTRKTIQRIASCSSFSGPQKCRQQNTIPRAGLEVIIQLVDGRGQGNGTFTCLTVSNDQLPLPVSKRKRQSTTRKSRTSKDHTIYADSIIISGIFDFNQMDMKCTKSASTDTALDRRLIQPVNSIHSQRSHPRPIKQSQGIKSAVTTISPSEQNPLDPNSTPMRRDANQSVCCKDNNEKMMTRM